MLLAITRKIAELQQPDVAKAAVWETLQGLDELVPSFGLSEAQLGLLLDLATTPARLFLAAQSHISSHLLLCGDPIPTSAVMKVVVAVGVHSKLPRTLQLRLLRWLVCSVPFWADPNLALTLYGLMFHTLGVEYTRLLVAFFVFQATQAHHLSPWRVSFIRDLQRRFPRDLSLQALRVLLDPAYETFTPLLTSPFRHPHRAYLAAMERLGPAVGVNAYQPRVDPQVRRLMERIDAFHAYVGARSAVLRFLIHSPPRFVDDLHSPQSFLALLDHPIANANLIMLEYLQTEGLVSDWKLHYWLDFHTPTEHTVIDRWLTLVLAETPPPTLIPKLVRLYILSGLTLAFSGITALLGGFKQTELWEQGLASLMPLVPPMPGWDAFYTTYLVQNLQRLEADVAFCLTFVVTILDTLRKWADRPNPELLQTISGTLILFHNLLLHHPRSYAVDRCATQCLTFTLNLSRTKGPMFALLQAQAVVLPPGLMASLILSLHPLIVSSLCEYIAVVKTYTFESQPEFKKLHNSYVMDACNFLWRDKAYESSPGTVNKGLFLSSEVVSQAAKLPDERAVLFRRVGNIFHNPAFASIAAHIVRDLEDEDPACEVRHAGPLTPESVAELLEQPVPWLNTTYDDLRIDVLRRLGPCGYEGVPNLLFTSLKSLLDRR